MHRYRIKVQGTFAYFYETTSTPQEAMNAVARRWLNINPTRLARHFMVSGLWTRDEYTGEAPPNDIRFRWTQLFLVSGEWQPATADEPTMASPFRLSGTEPEAEPAAHVPTLTTADLETIREMAEYIRGVYDNQGDSVAPGSALYTSSVELLERLTKE